MKQLTHYERFLVKTTDEIFEASCKEGMTWSVSSPQEGDRKKESCYG